MSFSPDSNGNGAMAAGKGEVLSVSCGTSGIWRLRWRAARGRRRGGGTTTIPTFFEPRPLEIVGGEVRAAGVEPLRLSSGPLSPVLRWGCLSFAVGRIAAGDTVSSPRIGAKRAAKIPRRGARIAIDECEERRYFGLGERTGFLDKKGELWENWTTDVGKISPRTDPLYQAHPFLLGFENGTCFGLFLNDTRRSTFDLAASSREFSEIRVEGAADTELYLLPGPAVSDVVEQLAGLVGRPPLPPLWAFGYHHCRWSFLDEREAAEIGEGFHRRKIPLSALWLDIDYMEGYKVFTFDPSAFPDPPGLVRRLSALGIRTVVIVDPAVKIEPGYHPYESGREIGAYITTAAGADLVGEVWPKPVVWPDFSRAEVRQWWGSLHRFYLENGIGGIWNDMNEPSAFKRPGMTLPRNARQGGGSHAELHNVYGLQMSEATYEGLQQLQPERRPFVLTRSGFTGIQKFAWVWTGDNRSSWEDLEGSLPMLFNLGLSAVPFVGADIGGFYSDCGGELFARWCWLGAFYPFMRCHSAVGTARQEPWHFEPEVEAAAAAAIRFRYRLLPYLYTLAQESSATGLPLLRPLIFSFSDDGEASSVSDQAMLGEALLVAPAVRPRQKQRLVYLPEGDWFCFWRGEKHSGRRWISVETPLDSIPLFQRSGAAVPLAGEEPQSETAEWEEVWWNIAPGERIAGAVYRDRGEGFDPGRTAVLQGHALPGGPSTLILTGAMPGERHTAAVLDSFADGGRRFAHFEGQKLEI